MIRGTTEQFKFKLPYPKKDFVEIVVRFWQPNNNMFVPIYKDINECASTEKPNEICISLTVAETAKFSDKFRGKVQLKATHTTGSVFSHVPRTFSVYPMADDIIGDISTTIIDGWIVLDGKSVVSIEGGDIYG